MNNNLNVPKNKRHRFAQPLGKLIAGTRQETLIQVEDIIRNYLKTNLIVNFYIVGDIVTKDFLANQYLRSFIKLCIIDEKTQREKITIDTDDFFEAIIEFENPKGTIQNEIWVLLENIINSGKRTLLRITSGEEDLLVLPLVLQIPLKDNVKNLVFYGQPPITDAKITIPEGIVIVDLNEKIQKRVKKFIALMDKL